MSRSNRVRVRVSPWAAVLLAVFLLFASPNALGAAVLAALCHEWGHWLTARLCGAGVEEVYISPFGVQMCLTQRPTLSYGREALVLVAGPAVNIALAFFFARCGARWPLCYTMAGAQLILGAFNLLPVRPLDGGNLLWLVIAWASEPITAERMMRRVELVSVALLFLLALWIWRETESPFLLLAVAGMAKSLFPEKRLVKERKRR